MCGISGGFAFEDKAEPIDRSVILRLNEFQRRRGPDGAGIWSSKDDRVALGHRRLAVIDTGSSGVQPMSDSTGRWIVSFNGEIYNYRALRSDLERLGCVFRTNSDTEVLINVVAHWGEAGLRKLRGMYAFVLWDSLNRELWLVRDPYGIKPLYWSIEQGRIWFASQARALATCAPVDTRRDSAALTGLYLWGHIPEPFCWWAGIRMFPPGHVQRIGVGRAVSPPHAFFCVQGEYVRNPPRPLAPGELRALMLESVQHHLVADVPVGIFLSAGIDSSVIASLAAETSTKLRTVTLGFKEFAGTADDETVLAEATATALKSSHTTVWTGRDEFEEILDDFLECMDQPTIDGLNTYLVSAATAKQGLKVALSGLGGDELFGGYSTFYQLPKLMKWGCRIPFSESIGRMVQVLATTAKFGIPPKAFGLLAHSHSLSEAYILRRALYLEGELDALLDESWLKEGLSRLSTVRAVAEMFGVLNTGGSSLYAQISALESMWYMRNQLLRDADWSSMAHGLEIRLPFVDTSLLERLGPAIASDRPPTKIDLWMCSQHLATAVRDRSKTGFGTPVRSWMAGNHCRSERGLRGWVANVHRAFRVLPSPILPQPTAD